MKYLMSKNISKHLSSDTVGSSRVISALSIIQLLFEMSFIDYTQNKKYLHDFAEFFKNIST